MPNSPDEQRAMGLHDRGVRLMQQGHFEEAIACFQEAWNAAGLVSALNNWATVLQVQGRPAEALQVLEPVLGTSLVHPYTHALASRCCTAVGDTRRARDHLYLAIRSFDAGRSGLAAHPDGGQAWIEYTMIIKEAAFDLGDYRLILDLHSRWPGRDLPQGAFVAGVAAFNLGKYPQAIRIWLRVQDRAWVRPLKAYILVAQLVERGVVPPFTLDAQLPDTDRLKNLTPDEAAKAPVEGSLRLLMLTAVFSSAEDDPRGDAGLVAELIRRTGDWGIDLGRRLLQGATVGLGLKFGAARALTEAGLFRSGEPIPVVHEGRPTQIVVQMRKVASGPIPELEEVMAEARKLWEHGRQTAALKRVTDLHDHPVVYPPAMLLEAYFLRELGRLDEALDLLEQVDDLMPDQPSTLFQMALVHLARGDRETARRLAESIDPSRVSPAFHQDLARLKARLDEDYRLVEGPETYVAAFLDSMRAEADERPIALDVKLATALRRIPVQWLNAAAIQLAVQPQRRRPEREQALAAALLDPDRLQAVLAAEAPLVREALAFVLKEGGWVKLRRLTRRFGDQAGDGFHWDEHPPASPLGRLRMLGIVHVGRAQIDGRNCKVAVVPVELRPLLTP